MRIYSKVIQLLTIVLFSATAYAQPVNDDCSGAINIGTLLSPGACIGGIQDGAPITLNNQTTVDATSPNPYDYQTACQGGGDMTVFALDTWYMFTASGTTVNVSISGYNNAEMAIYSGTCGNLLGLGCSTNGTMVVNQTVVGQTYYMQISGNTTSATDNNFSINIDNDIDCNDCLTLSSLTASPQPVNGGYTPGQVVSFCYTVSNFNEINTNWFHGVQISMGAGWTGTFSNITPAADCNVDVTPGIGNAGAGVWSWYPGGVTSSANGTVWPAGFYFDNANITGTNAGNNFGDPGNCGWTFCWDLTVSSTCLNGASLNVNVNTTGDGESGSWASPGCVDDPSTVFAAVQLCCPLTATNTGAYCVGGTIQLNGTGGGTYSWSGPNGFSSTLQNPTLPATIAAAGVYTLEINNAGCISTTTTTVVVNPINTVGNASTNPTLCVNTAISPDITFTTVGASGIGSPTGLPAGVTATFSSNTITVSGTPPATGTFNYSIPLTGGCGLVNAIGTITVTDANTVGPPSYNPGICLGTSISPDITFTTSGATGIGAATGLPIGVTATFAGNTITVSGTPTSNGVFNYSIPLTGGCGLVNATGTITVSDVNTVSAASSSPTICINTSISPTITFNTTLATGIGAPTGLPAGVTATFAANTITVSGTPTAVGIFNYTIPLTGGCGLISAIGTITVNPTNTVSPPSSNPILCLGTTVAPDITFNTSNATGIGAAAGLPIGVTATFSANTITISGTPTAAGIFNYSIPLTGGCGSINATGTITVLQPVTPTFTQLGPYCPTGTADLLNTSSTNLPAIIGVWNPATISTAAIGTVTYTFTSNPGQCANNTTMDITVIAAPIPVIAVNQTSGCVPLTVTFTTTNFPTAQYSWTVNGSVFSTSANTTYMFNQGGCYDIELVVSANGCFSSILQNDLICVENNPVASFVPSATTFFDNSQNILFTNNSVGATSYSWNFGDQQNSTLENPSHVYSDINGNVLVTLTATSALGCTNQYSVVIEYVEETIFYVPNAFTPDEDEYNQTWGPVFTQGFDPFNFELFIYDRWGELIWESHDASVGWDGTYQGALQIGALGMSCQEGVYTWKINYKPKETDEKKVVVGHLTLLR